jgi:CDP-diacylglycerol--glycerol-3-phosphate 3-phosphatidyltransferase
VTIYDLKPRFQALLRPLTAILCAMGVTANQVTAVACVISLGLGALLGTCSDYTKLFVLLPIWLFLRMALNAIDGMLARDFGQESKLGGILNELTDVISDAALYLPFAFLPQFGWWEVSLVVFLAALSEMTGVVTVAIGASRRYDGPMGKSDRALALGALGLAIGLGMQPAAWQQWIFPALAVLLGVTILNRARRGLAEATED